MLAITLEIAQYLRNGRPGLTFRDMLYHSGMVDLRRIYVWVNRDWELGDDALDVHHCEVVNMFKRDGPCMERKKPE